MVKKLFPLLALSILLACNSGCGTTGTATTPDPAVTSGNVLIGVQQTIVNIHEAFRAPCLSGVIPAADCQKVDQLTAQAEPAYDAAAAANIVALQTGSTADYTAKKAALDTLIGDMTALAVKYAIEPKGGAK
jgi:hypothetical protein